TTWGGAYDESSPAGHALRERRRRLLELVPTSGRHILDVGCGPAVLAGDLAGEHRHYVGVDAAPSMVRWARTAATRDCARLAVAVAETLPFPDSRFDVVVCLGVIDRLADQARALEELLRVARPGGVVLI